jgi:glycosyltransferase involved in cell wall biosynthesis
MKQIYIAWIGYQRRAESMSDFFDFNVYYIKSRIQAKRYKLFSYLSQARRMLLVLWRTNADVVWIQSPPAFVLHILVVYKALFARRVRVVADLHNAALRLPWSAFPLNRFMLKRADVVLVHNHHVVDAALRIGVSPSRLRVLRDRVPVFASPPVNPSHADAGATIVMPCSFHADEPVAEVLRAAESCPSMSFVITGNLRRAHSIRLVENAPANVTFPGFLSIDEFDRLLLRASAVLCLTTEDGVQLSSAAEALAAGKPMIMSDTSLLRELFQPAGIFVDNTAGSIAAACQDAVDHYPDHAAASERLREKMAAQWPAEAEVVRGLIAAG